MWIAVVVPLAVLLLPLGLHRIEASLSRVRVSRVVAPARPRARHLVAVPRPHQA